MASPVILMPTMASATPESDLRCGTTTPAATLVAPDLCEVLVTESGTFTAPSGITKLAAFVVGAGSGGWGSGDSFGSYGGGGGAVVYVDSVDVSGPIDVTIGAGGASGASDVDKTGGNTSVNGDAAVGGFAPDQVSGGISGNGYGGNGADCLIDTVSEYASGGGGAISDAVGNAGGDGLLLSDFFYADSTLFPVLDAGTRYGAGGDSCSVELTTAHSGNGGSASNTSSQNGSDGVVIFRYSALTEASAPVESAAPAALAVTGPSANSSLTTGAASALFAAGAALLLLVRRSRKNA
jgi:hypothetical protein